jgi:acyl-CoA synthetase (AMP-forming)/AMP-acid ligase II
MIKTAGSNVSPEEVESILREMPGLSDAIVVGLPHAVRGEEVVALVILEPGAVMTPDQLIAHARAELASYKVPRHVRFVDESQVPLLPTGKVDRAALVKLFDESST